MSRRICYVALALIFVVVLTGCGFNNETTPYRAKGTSHDYFIIELPGNYFIRKSYETDGPELIFRQRMSKADDKVAAVTPQQKILGNIKSAGWKGHYIYVETRAASNNFVIRGSERQMFSGKRVYRVKINLSRRSDQIDRLKLIPKEVSLKPLTAYAWNRTFLYRKTN